VGGQDNVQAVAGPMLCFFRELGFLFPQFPYVAHSRGWAAGGMGKHVAPRENSGELHEGARAAADRALPPSQHPREGELESTPEQTPRGGRKAHRLTIIE